ncbi:MAG: hypothetical protein QJR02_07230 [Sinobacteraceae bacterium]|nr:hypothetical protein [Nevskiaceae bacterium]
MALKLKFAPKGSYRTRVTVLVPQDLGKSERCEFTVEFKRLTVSEYRALVADTVTGAAADEDIDQRLLSAVIIGWDGLLDDAGQPVPFSAENLAAVLDVLCYRHALREKFYEGMRNPAELMRKN